MTVREVTSNSRPREIQASPPGRGGLHHVSRRLSQAPPGRPRPLVTRWGRVRQRPWMSHRRLSALTDDDPW